MAFGIPILDFFVGKEKAKGFAAQEQQAQVEAQMARLRGVQIGEQSRYNLRQQLGNIGAVQAARGVSNDSQTANAIVGQTQDDMYRNEAVARLAELNRAGAADSAAAGYKAAKGWAIPMELADSFMTSARMAASLGGA